MLNDLEVLKIDKLFVEEENFLKIYDLKIKNMKIEQFFLYREVEW